ncbi:unnamed protein product [Gulo gulo]|uniref:Uncharacterized protein n=1 Tax=Gulo gulo TaxID=48420 RepID=A0A9X9Q990_GULGU|nr:unnamed protein product [Gulo gulo]
MSVGHLNTDKDKQMTDKPSWKDYAFDDIWRLYHLMATTMLTVLDCVQYTVLCSGP